MNRIIIATVKAGVAVLILFSSYQVFGQPEPMAGQKMQHEKANFHHGESWIPNLTEDQKTKMKDLHLAQLKEVKNFRNQLGELKAKQHTLATADKADIKAIDANIDEIVKVQGQLMKSRAQLVQNIRMLLTDEQRIYFDMRMERNHNFRRNRGPEMRHEENSWNHEEKGDKGWSREEKGSDDPITQ